MFRYVILSELILLSFTMQAKGHSLYRLLTIMINNEFLVLFAHTIAISLLNFHHMF